ncbi:DUF799 domain-containing protein [Acetobacter sp. AN02]|nr:DUF799 domain-containing protein [Acetobacter sp. AN02]
MNIRTSFRILASASLMLVLSACGSSEPKIDYTAFRDAKPRSVLILPPVNQTTDISATPGMLSQMGHPLAEAGYYVIPAAVESETFRQNGLDTPNDIIQVPAAKLRQIFGADAALYTTVTQYGSHYHVVDSTVSVAASAKLVDLRTGSVLWSGTGSAVQQSSGGNLLGMLVSAAVSQVANSLSDASYGLAAQASRNLLAVGPPNGLLYGPRSPKYGTD